MRKKVTPPNVFLKNIEISYPSLFQTKIYEGRDTGKYSSTFSFKKHRKDLTKKINETFHFLQKKYGVVIKKDKFCLKDGDDEGNSSYLGEFFFNSSSSRKIIVMDQNLKQIFDETQISSGDIVHCFVSFWLQDNSYGKRINSELKQIILVKRSEGKREGYLSDQDITEIIKNELAGISSSEETQKIEEKKSDESLPWETEEVPF